jgi:hypothetical protein
MNIFSKMLIQMLIRMATKASDFAASLPPSVSPELLMPQEESSKDESLVLKSEPTGPLR